MRGVVLNIVTHARPSRAFVNASTTAVHEVLEGMPCFIKRSCVAPKLPVHLANPTKGNPFDWLKSFRDGYPQTWRAELKKLAASQNPFKGRPISHGFAEKQYIQSVQGVIDMALGIHTRGKKAGIYLLETPWANFLGGQNTLLPKVFRHEFGHYVQYHAAQVSPKFIAQCERAYGADLAQLSVKGPTKTIPPLLKDGNSFMLDLMALWQRPEPFKFRESLAMVVPQGVGRFSAGAREGFTEVFSALNGGGMMIHPQETLSALPSLAEVVRTELPRILK